MPWIKETSYPLGGSAARAAHDGPLATRRGARRSTQVLCAYASRALVRRAPTADSPGRPRNSWPAPSSHRIGLEHRAAESATDCSMRPLGPGQSFPSAGGTFRHAAYHRQRRHRGQDSFRGVFVPVSASPRCAAAPRNRCGTPRLHPARAGQRCGPGAARGQDRCRMPPLARAVFLNPVSGARCRTAIEPVRPCTVRGRLVRLGQAGPSGCARTGSSAAAAPSGPGRATFPTRHQRGRGGWITMRRPVPLTGPLTDRKHGATNFQHRIERGGRARQLPHHMLA